jgi:hypothetical protein
MKGEALKQKLEEYKQKLSKLENEKNIYIKKMKQKNKNWGLKYVF